MADHFNFDGAVEADRDVVGAVRVEDGHVADFAFLGTRVQEGVELPQGLCGQVEGQAFHTYISSGAGSKTLACLTPGRWARERNSEAMAT